MVLYKNSIKTNKFIFKDSKFELCKAMFYGVKAKDEVLLKNRKFDFVTSV